MYLSIQNILTTVRNKDIYVASVYNIPYKHGDGEQQNDKNRSA